MEQYRLTMYFALQIGLMLRFEDNGMIISIPFIDIGFVFSKEANGINLFNIIRK